MMNRRWTSLVLALALALSLVPVTASLAEETPERAIDVEESRDAVEEIVGELPEDFMMDPVDGETPEATVTDAFEDAGGVAASNAVPEQPEGAADIGEAMSELMRNAYGAASNAAPNAAVKHSVKITQKKYVVTIKGSVPSGYVLGGMIMDDSFVTQDVFGKSINYKIDMNSGDFATGYHTVVVGIYKRNVDGTLTYADLIMGTKLKTNLIKDKPTYKGVFEVYHNYLNIYPFDLTQNQAGNLYLEYSSNGGKTWKRSGAMTANWIQLKTEQGFKISGLKSRTSYRTRLRYGEYVTYSASYNGDDKSHFFGGPVLKTATIKTGASRKPSIKSVKAKATNVKYHKHKVKGHYEWSGSSLIWIGSYTERYYTCNIKLTITLNKKPGTKGIWVYFYDDFTQTKWLKGNKTTYTITLTPIYNYFTRKPKGNYSYKFKVCSGQSKTWGGYSPSWSGTKKLS